MRRGSRVWRSSRSATRLRRSGRWRQRRIAESIGRTPKLANREVHGEVKCVLKIRDVLQRHVSAPFVAATDEQKRDLEALIDELQLFETTI